MRTKNAKSAVSVKTSLGEFVLEASSKGLYCLSFPKAHKKSGAPAGAETQVLKLAAEKLKKYLKGEPVNFESLRIDYSDYTDSEAQVLRALAKVKPGEVISYERLSRKAGFKRAARFVGSVMSKNRLPIILPCHRVLRSDGGLGGYSLGLSWKKRLLAVEKPRQQKAS